MSSIDMHDQDYNSDSDSSDSEGKAYAPRKSATRTLRPIFGLIENEGPSITLTTPSSRGNPSLTVQDDILAKKVAEPGKINPGTWRQAIAQHRRVISARRKEMRSRSEEPNAYRAGPGWGEYRTKSGKLRFINYNTGESTREEPKGYLDPNGRFELGMGIKQKPRPKSADQTRRKSGLWEPVMCEGAPEDDGLCKMFQRLMIQVDESREDRADEDEDQGEGEYQDEGEDEDEDEDQDEVTQEGTAYQIPRGWSRTSKPRYYAQLQAASAHDISGPDGASANGEGDEDKKTTEQAKGGESTDLMKKYGSSIGRAVDRVGRESPGDWIKRMNAPR